MNELYEYYWQRYLRLLYNTSIPDHLIESAYKVFNTLHRKEDRLFLASIKSQSVFTK